MTKKIFRSICLVALAVLIASVVLIMGVLYGYFTDMQHDQLRMQTELAAQGVNHEGTAYFDPELDHLSQYYQISPGQRAYFILEDDKGQVAGGVGLAEFGGIEKCAELQKLYLADAWKGRGYGKRLVETVLGFARSAGYERVYLETHTNLQTALCLYEKFGFRQIERPKAAVHSTMDRFYLKELREERMK